MTLDKRDITEIIAKRHCTETTVLDWTGFHKIKLIDKNAVLHDIWHAFCGEFDEQRKFLEEEVADMRRQIEAEKGQSDADLVASAPGYVFEELRVLFKEHEKELKGQLPDFSGGKSSMLERIQLVLEQDYDEQFRKVDQMEQDSLQHMNKLRRRLERMAKDLQLSEKEVDRLRESLMAAYDGVPSVYKAVQGLSVDEEDYQHKRDLLHLLFEENIKIRENVT
jgi:hypothetical protein